MAELHITEYANVDRFGRGVEPAVAIQSVTYTTTAESVPFQPATRWVFLKPRGDDAHILFGTGTLAATVANPYVSDLEGRYFAIVPEEDLHLAVYDGTTP